MGELQKDPIVVRLADGVEMKFLHIPAGTFRMGSREGEESEQPRTKVRVEEFYMAETPVTQAQYRVMAGWCEEELGSIWKNQGTEPSGNPGEENPVDWVNWYEARTIVRAFADRMNKKELGQDCVYVCLPSEEQWEYASRANSHTDYANGDGVVALREIGLYRFNTNHTIKEYRVGRKVSNLWGLKDMHGNVSEWVNDAWCNGVHETSPMYRLLLPLGMRLSDVEAPEAVTRRGGSRIDWPQSCRSASRKADYPSFRDFYIGFRLALVPGPSRQGEAGGREQGAQAAGAGKPTTEEESVPETAAGAGMVDLSEATFSPPQADE